MIEKNRKRGFTMRNKRKTMISILLIIALLCTVMQPGITKVKAKGERTGDGWKISEEGVLSITKFVIKKGGEGLVNNEWKDYKDEIKEIKVRKAEIVDLEEQNSTTEDELTSWNGLFQELPALTRVTIQGLDLSKISEVSRMFSRCEQLTTVSIDWKLGKNTKSMEGMFYECENLKKVDIEDWDVIHVLDMSNMFSDCTNLPAINLVKWHVREKANIQDMFYGCVNLTDCSFAENWDSTADDLEGCFSNIGDYDWEPTSCPEQNFSVFSDELRLTWLKKMPQRYIRNVRIRHIQGMSMDHEENPHYCELFNIPNMQNYSVSRLNRAEFEAGNTRLTIYQNEKKENSIHDKTVSEKAVVKNSSETVVSDKNGNVELAVQPKDKIEVAKESYVTRELTKSQLSVSKEIKLQKKSKDYPVISAVWVDKDYDVMNQYYSVYIKDSEEKDMMAEVDWGESSYGSIQLTQGDLCEKFDGNTISLNIGKKFDVSEPIYIVAIDKAGRSIQQELYFENDFNLQFSMGSGMKETPSDSKLPAFLSGTELTLGFNSDKLPVSVTIKKDGKFEATLGVNVETSVTPELDNDLEEERKFSRTFKDIKEAITRHIERKGVSNSDLDLYKNILSEKGNLKTGVGPVMAHGNIYGYMEGVYEKGKIELTGGNIVVGMGGSWGYTHPFLIGPVPAFFEAELSAELESKLGIKESDEKEGEYTYTGCVEITPSLDAGVGVGVSDVAYVKGGAEGSLPIKLGDQDSDATMSLGYGLSAYFEAGILLFTARLDSPKLEGIWLSNGTKKTESKSEINLNDASQYKLKNLSYLNKKSKFKINNDQEEKINENISKETFKSNVYRESPVQMITYQNGEQLAVWVDGDSDDINGITLFYSYFDGDTWSAPKEVENDGTMDSAPRLVCIDDTAYLTWQNATQKVDSKDVDKNMTLDDFCNKKKINFDIGVAMFDRHTEDGTFITTTIKNDNLDMIPQICGDSNNVYVVWVNNDQNNYFGAGTNNTIFSAKIKEESGEMIYEEVKKEYKSLNAISSLAVDYVKDDNDVEKLDIAYAMDDDGDFSTRDVHVYENGKRVSNQAKAECRPSYLDHTLYWYSNNRIVDKNGTIKDGKIATSGYQLLKVGSKKAVVYTKAKGLKNGLYLSYLNEKDHVWENPVKISDSKKYIGSFSVNVTPESTLSVLINSAEVKDQYDTNQGDSPYGEASLELISCKKRCDIELSEVSYVSNSYVAGDWMELNYTVTNSGMVPVKAADVKLTDKDDKIIATSYIYDEILPGQSVQCVIPFKTFEKAKQDAVLSIKPVFEKDINMGNNSKEVHLEYEDLMVENVTCGQNGNDTIISADVVNRGYNTHEDIEVKLIKGSQDGEVIQETKIQSIESFKQKTVSFNIQASDHEIYYVVIEQKEDLFKGNNSDFVKIDKMEVVTPVPAVTSTPTPTPTMVLTPVPTMESTTTPATSTMIPQEKNIQQNKKQVTIDGVTYKLGKNTAEACNIKKKNAGKIVIPDSIQYEKRKYKVTSIAADICKGNKKLKKLCIGKNVKKIGKKAFYKCKKMEVVLFKTTKLSNKTIGKKAFFAINKKVRIKVPKKKGYKKFIKSLFR